MAAGNLRDMATNSTQALEAKLRAIESRIQSGVSSTATDGTQVSVDLQALEREASRLREEIATRSRRRPRIGTLKIW